MAFAQYCRSKSNHPFCYTFEDRLEFWHPFCVVCGRYCIILSLLRLHALEEQQRDGKESTEKDTLFGGWMNDWFRLQIATFDALRD